MSNTSKELTELLFCLLDKLRESNNQTEFSSVWKYFLRQAISFRQLLNNRITRQTCPAFFESIGRTQTLQISIAGRCPIGSLVGFMLWLQDSQLQRCRTISSFQDLPPRSVMHIIYSIFRKGQWKTKIQTFEDHIGDLTLNALQLDLVLVGYPPEGDLHWRCPAEYLKPQGYIVLLDSKQANSFNLSIPEFRLSHLSVEGLQQIGFEEIKAQLESKDVILHEGLVDGPRLPLLEETPCGALFARTNQTSLDGSDSQQSQTGPNRKPDEYWKGRFVEREDTGSVPLALLFPADARLPTNRPSAEYQASREYFDRISELGELARPHLEGMGRPLLSHYYRQ